jgi:hypothetical protein
MSVAIPMTMIAAGMLQPVMSASGTAPAKTRTPSPRNRVTRKTTDVMRRASGPKRRSSRWYAVSCSPRK